MENELIIKKAVLQILDSNINMPVLSNTEMEIDDDIAEFLEKHISKMLADNNLKAARFMEGNNIVRHYCELLKDNPDEFLSTSIEVSKMLFGIMLKHVDIPSADLMFCLFTASGVPYLGIFKLNYKVGYTHFVQNTEDGNSNTIIKHKTLLPSAGQKVDECIFICAEDLSIKLIEKEYEIDGEKMPYISRLLLNCETDLSSNEKIKIINKTVEKINKKYFDEDFEKAAMLKMAITESIEEHDSVDVDYVAKEVFGSNIEVQQEYLSEIEKSGLRERKVYVPEEMTKKFQTHKIKTDTGIEINFPMEFYDDSDKIEFLNNADGSISIVIKNVTKIVNK